MSTATKPPTTKTAPAADKAQPLPKADWNKPTNKNGLESLAPLALKQLERGLPRFLMGSGDRLIRSMITECQKTPALFDCTPVSLFGCVIQAGQLGLTIGGPLGEAYMLPFNNSRKGAKEAQLVVGYKGYIQLAHRSEKLRRITPRVVREGDAFQVRYGTEQDIRHVPVRNNQGRITDYYVSIELTTGGVDFETFTVEEAIQHRDRFATSRNWKNGPWYDMAGGGFDGMALKSLVRKLAKRMPLSVDMSTAAALDEMADFDVPQQLAAEVLPALPAAEADRDDRDPDDQAAHLRDRLEKARAGDGRLPGAEGETDISALQG